MAPSTVSYYTVSRLTARETVSYCTGLGRIGTVTNASEAWGMLTDGSVLGDRSESCNTWMLSTMEHIKLLF